MWIFKCSFHLWSCNYVLQNKFDECSRSGKLLTMNNCEQGYLAGSGVGAISYEISVREGYVEIRQGGEVESTRGWRRGMELNGGA